MHWVRVCWVSFCSFLLRCSHRHSTHISPQAHALTQKNSTNASTHAHMEIFSAQIAHTVSLRSVLCSCVCVMSVVDAACVCVVVVVVPKAKEYHTYIHSPSYTHIHSTVSILSVFSLSHSTYTLQKEDYVTLLQNKRKHIVPLTPTTVFTHNL